MHTSHLSRRDALLGASFVAMSGALPQTVSAKTGRPAASAVPDADYFLSPGNPMATADQRAAEEIALRLIAHPKMQAARTMAGNLFQRLKPDLGEEMLLLDAFLDEYMFHYALRAANSDPNYPKVVRFMAPPHRSFGRDLPGSRWGGDSPDFIYRTAALSYGPRYELRGRVIGQTPPTSFYSLMEDRPSAPTILALLEDIEIGSNGEFVITLDPTPANGRKNHIQTRPHSWQIWNRDATGDWLNQSANAMRIFRLDPPDRDPVTDEEMAERASREAVDGVYYYYYFIRGSLLLPANQLKPPGSTALMGGLASQRMSGGNIGLADDEAMIMTANQAGARFRNAVLLDNFGITLNYWGRITSLNHSQMAPDADGLFTYVVAHHDPGVHNWLDGCGRKTIRFGHRWQAFDPAAPAEAPSFSSRIVKIADLGKELPAGVRRIDAAGRKAQISLRRQGFERRFYNG